jgi:amino acid adenylation domain-containing protein
MSARHHVLLWSLHHMLFDGWSVGVLLRELAADYEAFSSGRPSPLGPLAMQYGDFVRWQRHATQSDRFRAQRRYWQSQLRDLPPRLDLPTDYPRRTARPTTSARFPLSLPRHLTDSLKSLAHDEGYSLFMMLVAAFKVLLYRYSEQRDICVGTIIANRNRIETEDLIGCFINTLVLRTELPEGATVRDVLQRVRDTTLDAYAHQDLPFEIVLDELRSDQLIGQRALFQAMLVLQSTPLPKVSPPNLSMELQPDSEEGQSDCDLTLWLSETDDGLRGSIEYGASLFQEATIARLHGHFQTLLKSFVAQPEQDIDRLPLLSIDERKHLESTKSGPAPTISQALTVHARFEKQAERTPDNTAVVAGHSTLTYRALNRLANQLARDLREHGLGPEICVGLCIERSPEMVVAMLGVLKAGGAFVALDPDHPEARLRHILAETRAPIVLTQEHLTSRLPDHDDRTVICLDRAVSTPTPAEDINPQNTATLDHLACVIYTSGSTGRPKGVALTHGSLACATSTLCETFEPSPRDRILQFAALSYSTSLEEIFPCLVSGAALVLRDGSMLDTVSGFVDACEAQTVTVLDLPTSYWHVLAASMSRHDLRLPSSVRLVIIGGQPALRERLVDWRNHVDASARLVNTYGPTEVSVVATMCDLAKGDLPSHGPYCPIGKAVGHVEAYVLDKHLQAVPVGVAGELYIGGGGLARGYLCRPDETANAFAPHPFSALPGERLYRTGDRVRHRHDGNLEYLGRTDDQIKIRGVRIELGEIEAVIAEHPSVREAVLTAQDDGSGEPWLAAYVAPAPGQTIDLNALGQLLKTKLPDVMLPSSYTTLPALPRTSSEKVDRKALPPPVHVSAKTPRASANPRTLVESRLADIWASVLDQREVGIDDNFFELGGDSLLAVKLLSDIEAMTGDRIPLVALFQGGTIRHIAGLLDPEPDRAKSGNQSSSAIVAIQPDGSNPPFFAGGSHPRYADVARRLGPNQPFYRLDVYGLQSQRRAEGRKAYTRIDRMAAHFIKELRAVQPVGPFYLGGGCEGGIVAFEMALQLQGQGEEIANLLLWTIEAPGHFTGPFKPRSGLSRAINHARDLLRHGSLRGMSPREWATLIGHEITEYRIFRAVERYAPAGRFRGKIAVARIGAPTSGTAEDLSMGWNELGTEGADVHVISGSHDTWFETHTDSFSDVVEVCLSTARRK